MGGDFESKMEYCCIFVLFPHTFLTSPSCTLNAIKIYSSSTIRKDVIKSECNAELTGLKTDVISELTTNVGCLGDYSFNYILYTV